MLICSNCGSPLEVDSLFCEKCGQRVEKLEKNSSNKSKTPIKTINTNIKPLDIKIIILKTILFLLIAFTLDTLVIGLNWVIYENSKISYVTKVSSLGTETIQQPGPIDWGLGFILIVLFPLIIGTIQALIHNYSFSESIERFNTSEKIVYLIIPMIHISFLIYYFSLTPSSSDLFYVGNMVMSCELFIGAIYLFARITRITKLFNNVLTLSEIDKLTDKKIKADNNMLLNTFELRGGKKG